MMVMKSVLPGLVLLFLVSSIVSGQGSVLVKSSTQIEHFYTWQEAQAFGRSHYTDLAVFYEQSDADSLNLQPCCSWVRSRPNDWNVSFSFWPSQNSGCTCVNYSSRRFNVTDCEGYYFFICQEKGGNNKFINESKTWSDAQQYCSSFYDDLAFFPNSNLLYSAAEPQDFPVWIGLYRDGKTWQWSSGVSDFRGWAPNQLDSSSDCVAISSTSRNMTTQSCSARYPFICSTDNLVLVKENKTWEEALEYCKALRSQTNSPHQLVSVQPGDYSYMTGRAMEADTDEVWTGLRFLAGSWMWVNRAHMSLSDLPLCPVSGQNCGAFSKNDTGSLRTRECAEKKNFLCYRL